MAYQSCLIYHFLVAALFWDVCFFLIFSLNHQQGVTQCCIHINKWEEITKSTLDQANVHHLKGLTSLYIISYLHFLNLNNILTLPKTLVDAEAEFGLTWIINYVRLVFCLPDLHACALAYEIKTNAGLLCMWCFLAKKCHFQPTAVEAWNDDVMKVATLERDPVHQR